MAGPFDYSLAANFPVGAVLQSPINLETLTGGLWVAMDGRDAIRTQFVELAQNFSGGVFTTTTRTLNATPAVGIVAADTVNFAVAGAAGTAALQTSADGITWTGGTNWTASTQVASLIVAGTRWIVATSAGALQPLVINTGGTAAALANMSNWTATTSAAQTTLLQGLAYGSTANAGAGRTVMVKNGATDNTGFYYLNDGSTAWTNVGAGGNTVTKSGIAWTGLKYIVPCTDAYSVVLTSTDGNTWTQSNIPFALCNGYRAIASDGNGTVIIAFSIASIWFFIVSKDHGTTWRKIQVSQTARVDTSGNGTLVSGAQANWLQFINGKFVFTPLMVTNSAPMVLISADGLVWSEEPLVDRGSVNLISAMAWKANVYCGINSAVGTGSITATEDMSKFRMPETPGMKATSNGGGDSPFMSYIKARSN